MNKKVVFNLVIFTAAMICVIISRNFFPKVVTIFLVVSYMFLICSNIKRIINYYIKI